MNIRYSFFLAIILGFNIANATVQSIEVVNDSDNPVHIAANTQALRIDYTVPSNTHSVIVSQVTKLKSPQELLFEAILADSKTEMRKAIQRGANINQLINGKSAVVWAVLFKKINAIQYLLELGATL
jgi:lipopolysaccharide export system protein LptA